MELQVQNAEGKVVEAIQFDESCLGTKVKKRLLKQAVVAYASHLMSGTRSTKKRGEVSGGGKKPYKQKHTGRARMGSIRSPLLRGGGIIFGPQSNENPRKEMTRSMRREALKSALLAKFLDKEVKVIDELKFDGPKTSRMAGILKAFGMNGHSCLIALAVGDDATWKSARNIPRLSVFQVGSLNAYAVLKRSMLLFTKEAVVKLPEVLKR